MFKIRDIRIDPPLVLAPVAGHTDSLFRQVIKGLGGCGLVVSELVSTEGMTRHQVSSSHLTRFEESERPVSIQIFGADSARMAESAAIVEAMGADILDINLGCPVKKVVKQGGGSNLLRDLPLMSKILTAVRKAIKAPLTVKIRSGWDQENINAVKISKIAEECGVDAISIHPRTKVQGFHGRADWNLIGEVKKTVRIPVIGNGDVATPLLAKKMFEETGCDGVMIGRGALGNPWIFRFKNSMHLVGEPVTLPALEERENMIHYHFLLTQAHYGEKGAVKVIRKHVYWYTKGLPGCSSFHSKLSGLREKEALFEGIHSYFDFVQRRNQCQSSESTESRSVTG